MHMALTMFIMITISYGLFMLACRKESAGSSSTSSRFNAMHSKLSCHQIPHQQHIGIVM